MNRFSDKINGYWEAGNHYYIEIRDDRLSLRGNTKALLMDRVKISYDAAAAERGEKTPLVFEDNALTRDPDGEPMSWFEESYFENGELKLLRAFSFMDRKDADTAVKVDHGPFDHIIYRDEEFLDKLQGTWHKWGPSIGGVMVIRGNEISWLNSVGKFRVVSYKYAPDKVYLVNENLVDEDFGGFTKVEVKPDMLITTMIVYDMSMPLSVFARKEMLDKIEVPEGAKRVPENTMMYKAPTGGIPGMNTPGMMGIGAMMGLKEYMEAQKKQPQSPPAPREFEAPKADAFGKFHCPVCGYALEAEYPKFCPECASPLRKL